ncbi:transposase [Streptomyces sp. NPDC032472]|uniref:IS701 family transposase n=1 Tax=Streptomyces sp. NPDC032472 TaxID=3155018 RepID=UPI0033DA73CC
MTADTRPRALVSMDTALDGYTERLFGHLPRADQRRWAQAYLQGLLTTPGKKSVRRLAASVSASPTASQSLQQFINASPWDWDQARLELLHWVEERHPVHAWTIGQAVLPKRGEHSVGVHRRFDPAAGRTVNGQFGLGLFLSLGATSVPVDWRLMLPEAWTDDPGQRRRARITPGIAHRAPEALVLELVESIAAHTSAAHAPVVADLSRLTGAAALLGALARRGHDFLVSVPPTLTVRAAGLAPGRGDAGRAAGCESTAGDLARLGNTRHPYTAVLTGPAARAQPMRIHSGLVRVPGAETGTPATGRGTYRLFGERRPGLGHRGGPVWITNMTEHRMDDLLYLARQSTEAGRALGTLAEDFGLLDFAGRSFPGWHHHMTLVSAAYAYKSVPSPRDRQNRPGLPPVYPTALGSRRSA